MRGQFLRARALVFAIPLALTACGSSDEGGNDQQNPPEDENILTFATGEFEIPAGDSFTCFYLDAFTDRDLAVSTASGHQDAGGHHIVVYWADEAREPGYHECEDWEMVNLHQIAGTSGEEGATTAEGSLLGLPDGLALQVPAGKQLVLQAHYINTTGASMRVNDSVNLHLTDPKTVEAYVNYLVTLDEQFQVPPNARYSSVSTCTLERDFDMVIALGHMHELGERYAIEIIDENDNVVKSIRDDKWQASYTSHPPVSYFTKQEPLHLAKGTRLRQSCTWNNNTPEKVMFPREMCLAFFYYFPADGDLICDMKAVEAESGTQ